MGSKGPLRVRHDNELKCVGVARVGVARYDGDAVVHSGRVRVSRGTGVPGGAAIVNGVLWTWIR